MTNSANLNNLTQLTQTHLTQITELCEELHSNPDLPSVLGHIQDHIDNEDNPDFEVDGVRFINSANIDSILAAELFDDIYLLGCFSAGFINDNTPVPIEAIEAMQSTGSYEALGLTIEAMLDDDGQLAFAAAYASAKGYGHHFNRHDFSEEEINIGSQTWYVFDNRSQGSIMWKDKIDESSGLTLWEHMTLCAKIAKIEGHKVTSDGIQSHLIRCNLMSDTPTWLPAVCDEGLGLRTFDPLRDDALCFRLMLKYGITVENKGTVYEANTPCWRCAADKSPNVAICKAIIEILGVYHETK